MAKKTLKQKWVFERLFCHSGSLVRMETRLRNIATAPSTLASERLTLQRAATLIRSVSMKSNPHSSWQQYKAEAGK